MDRKLASPSDSQTHVNRPQTTCPTLSLSLTSVYVLAQNLVQKIQLPSFFLNLHFSILSKSTQVSEVYHCIASEKLVTPRSHPPPPFYM